MHTKKILQLLENYSKMFTDPILLELITDPVYFPNHPHKPISKIIFSKSSLSVMSDKMNGAEVEKEILRHEQLARQARQNNDDNEVFRLASAISNLELELKKYNNYDKNEVSCPLSRKKINIKDAISAKNFQRMFASVIKSFVDKNKFNVNDISNEDIKKFGIKNIDKTECESILKSIYDMNVMEVDLSSKKLKEIIENKGRGSILDAQLFNIMTETKSLSHLVDMFNSKKNEKQPFVFNKNLDNQMMKFKFNLSVNSSQISKKILSLHQEITNLEHAIKNENQFHLLDLLHDKQEDLKKLQDIESVNKFKIKESKDSKDMLVLKELEKYLQSQQGILSNDFKKMILNKKQSKQSSLYSNLVSYNLKFKGSWCSSVFELLTKVKKQIKNNKPDVKSIKKLIDNVKAFELQENEYKTRDEIGQSISEIVDKLESNKSKNLFKF